MTIKLHAVKAYCDATPELFLKPENAIVRLEQLKQEYGEDLPSMDEVDVIDTRPEWGYRQ